MKFSIPLATAVLASTAYAQIDVVQGILSDVQSGIGSIDQAVQAFSGDAGPLVDASQALVGTLTDGTATVSASEDLTLEDALGLQQPVQDLTAAAQALVENLKAQKSALAEAGFCDETREQVTSINSASNELIDAVVAKVPSAAQPIAQALVADLKSVLQEAQDEFSEANCQNSGGGEETSSEPAPTSTGGGEESSAPPTETPSQTSGGGGGDGSSVPPTETPSQTSGGGGGDGSSAPPTSVPTQTGGGGGGSVSHPVPTATSGWSTATSNAPGNGTSTQTTATSSTPGNGTSTETTGPPIATGGAGSVVPAGALALGFAVLLM